MNKIMEIFSAWGIMFNANESQNELAADRIQICNSCEHKTVNALNLNTCGLCGCALKAKVFSPVFDACPDHRWKEAELKHIKILK